MTEFPEVQESRKTHRLINSRWPTIGLFDDLADSEQEVRLLFNLEMLTNPRNQAATGRLALMPEGSVVTGPTANMVMAAFVHCHDDGGRFNMGRLGAWYAALDIRTAIEETIYHLTKRLLLSEGGFPQQMQMRQLITTIVAPVVDLCGTQEAHPELYEPEDYTQSQAFAENLRWPIQENGATGLRYESVRNKGGINVCIFKPDALSLPVAQGNHYQYDWNAAGSISIAKLTEIKL